MHRVRLSLPMGGVALFARGEGTKDPSDPDQGLSVLQTQNLQTIASAFKQLGIQTTTRADAAFPKGAIGVYFAPRTDD